MMVSPLKVLFLCRGSVQDGMGHVTRSRTVATVMQEQARVKLVVIGDRYVDNLLVNRGLDYSVVANELEAIAIWEAWNPQVVVFDLIRLDAETFHCLSQSPLTVSLSPIFNWLAKVDLLFHRTRIWGPDWDRDHQPGAIQSGLDYAVISEHCYRIPDPVYHQNLHLEPLSVAISMGGTDSANKTLRVLATLKQIPQKLLLWVMLGEGYTHSYQDLVDSMKGSRHEIILAKSNDSMWRVLSTCSLAVLAGGTTTYEAAYAGLPSINSLETERSYFLIQELVEAGVCFCAGTSLDLSLAQLNPLIERLERDRSLLWNAHQQAKALIDGRGAERIVQDIQEWYIQSA